MFTGQYICSINMTYRRVEIVLQDHASFSKTVSHVFLFFFHVFFFLFFVFTPIEFMITELSSDNAGT